MRILGIHDGHNAAAAVLIDGRVAAAVQEERFTREKNWSGFPAQSITWVLRQAGVDARDLDAVAMNGNHMPYPKDRDALLEEYRTTGTVATQLRRIARRTTFGDAYRRIRRARRLAQVLDLRVPRERVHFVDHHTAHAAAAYYGYGVYDEPVLVLTNDGAGDGLCASVRIGKGGQLHPAIATVSEADSIGNVFAVITFMMGMVPLEHEYKLMGLAPYAPDAGRAAVLAELRPLMGFSEGGGLTWHRTTGCPETYYSYDFLCRRLARKRFDWICAGLQAWTEEMLVQWVRNCIHATGIRKLALSGGVFMNVKANKAISELAELQTLFVFPSCGDETNAIGAAYWIEARGGTDGAHIPPLTDVYWGPDIGDDEIERALARHRGGWEARRIPNIDEAVADLLARGEVVARCAGRAEFGARALGNRSILADASRMDVVRVINDMIKSRDFWMPFAPAILADRAREYLINPKDLSAPYMILSFDGTPCVGDLRAAVHPYDLTLRPQVVHEEWNPEFHGLLKQFEARTGRGGILNTSFNLHGFPIVNGADDALEVLEKSGLEFLVLRQWLVAKRRGA